MKDLNKIGEELFSKLRGRFKTITIGNESGQVTNIPSESRFFDFDYNKNSKVSISLDDDKIAVMYSNKLFDDGQNATKKNWYDFLRELRTFARKRLLNFDVRDIQKSNLDRRDYKFLANKTGDNTMTESKLYGTSRLSYQDVDNARIVIKHTDSVSENRTQKIGSIYIESDGGERFKYPFKHLNGARAMARHVAEGGNPYDDFGKHITGLSEELNKLRKFKTYMSRSGVMAEGLAGYMDVVNDRIEAVKETVFKLQRKNFYTETIDGFETAVLEEVPEDISSNWIDQLTIRQFNEELKDVFPYIYKLVSEATKAQELGPDDLLGEKSSPAGGPACWDGYKIGNPKTKKGKDGKRVNNCVPEEAELDELFNQTLGQFAEGEDDLEEAYIKSAKDAIDTLGALRKIGKSIETGDGEHEGNLANMYVNDVYDVISWVENNLDTNDPKYTQVMEPVVALRKKAKGMETKPGSGKDARFGNEIVNTLYPLMQWIEMNAQGAQEGDDTMDVKIGPDGALSKVGADEPKEKKQIPVTEFILSLFDRETGQFPKGETAVLTAVEKDYGDRYIESAKDFIERIKSKYEDVMSLEPTVQEKEEDKEDDSEWSRFKKLATAIVKDPLRGDKAAKDANKKMGRDLAGNKLDDSEEYNQVDLRKLAGLV